MENNYQNLQARAIDRSWLVSLAMAGGLGITASLLPFFLHSQYITGPIINAVFILSLFWLGQRSAYTIAFMPSLAALLGGLLPLPLLPLVPFIIASNLLLILSLDLWRRMRPKSGYFPGLVLAALVKFTFLFLSAKMLGLILAPRLLPVLGQMFGLAQLWTALAGGLTAWAILKGRPLLASKKL